MLYTDSVVRVLFKYRDRPKNDAHAPKIAAQKKQPISILRDEKYLYQTALTLLNPDIVHNIYRSLDRDFFLKSQN